VMPSCVAGNGLSVEFDRVLSRSWARWVDAGFIAGGGRSDMGSCFDWAGSLSSGVRGSSGDREAEMTDLPLLSESRDGPDASEDAQLLEE
jgi:hypothetical protein